MDKLGFVTEIGENYIVLQNPRTRLSHRYSCKLREIFAELANVDPFGVKPDDIGFIYADIENERVVGFEWADESDVECEAWYYRLP